MNGGRRRRRQLVAGAIALALAAFAAATALLFVWPATDRPGSADAVVVLGGDGARRALGEALVRDGVAGTLAVSVGSPYDPCYRERRPYHVICFRAQPETTQGEGRWIGTMAKAAGWRRVVVVVSAPQATRARVRIRRCYTQGLEVAAVHVGAGRILRDTVYEWGALLKALTIQRGC
ncbi:MAG TPA: hypothetical protein VFA84_04640 [Acidimicrobiales bacterium]|nr:hypothetical protein [Acidimicrobiales bacterium]